LTSRRHCTFYCIGGVAWLSIIVFLDPWAGSVRNRPPLGGCHSIMYAQIHRSTAVRSKCHIIRADKRVLISSTVGLCILALWVLWDAEHALPIRGPGTPSLRDRVFLTIFESFSPIAYLGRFLFDNAHNHSGETFPAAQLITFTEDASVQLRLRTVPFWPIRCLILDPRFHSR
jgi:hypothetical protein